ncbi:MAG TPA: divalent metal cation transporter [Candidatus Methylacidiphilales bacterium]|jgi:NRAMP (natural resistance-associated macrophage protein)-like metal ion transporter|nr:divalent metal cation transporter [Candidatus Methylacidiphilales bacterium]
MGTDSPDKPGPLKRFLSILGPGVITGAADDDPSGIVTYTIAGAQAGTSLLWTALLTWPLMGAVQFMCARIGLVSGGGLGAALRKKMPRWLLVIAALALFAANTINVSADLAGMADVLQLLVKIPAGLSVIIIGLIIIATTVFFTYKAFASVLKWLAAALFAYVITGFLVHPHWKEILSATFLPRWPTSHTQWTTLVAILGTTISPYLFFWQASQEIEEEKEKGHRTRASRRGAPQGDINTRAIDVGLGAFFSNFIMYFIILTAASTLNRHGITQVESSRDAIRVLEPLAGKFASLLYATGLISVGFLAIPTLAGASAYAFAETFAWRQGLGQKLPRARGFYGTLVCSILFGVALCFTHVKPTDALFLTAVINGLLAPFLLVAIIWVASDNAIMQNQPSSWLARVVVGITTLGMFVAAVGVFM